MKRSRAYLPSVVLLLCAFSFQADEKKTSTALLADGQKLEADLRASMVTLGQLGAAIGKIDGQLEKIDSESARVKVEAEASDPAKTRLDPVLAALAAKRKPLEVEKARLDAERNRLTGQKLAERALDRYRKSADKAAAEGRKDVLARALLGVGRVSEILVPENVADAQAAYGRVVAEAGDVDPEAGVAREKIARKGVDVYVDQFAAFVSDWRDILRNSPTTLIEKKNEIWAKVQPLGEGAIHGLLQSLGHRDEVVRGFAAEMLADVINGDGLGKVIERLNDPSVDVRAGAGLAVNRIFDKWTQARAYDLEAEKIREDLASLQPDDPKAKQVLEKNLARAKENEENASKIRGRIPKELGQKGAVAEQLTKLLKDESAVAAARIEAAKAVEALGEVTGDLVDGILQGLSSKNRSVRESCCVAASGVDTTNSEAKHKLVDRLNEIIQYEPERDEKPVGERDLANDVGVRVAAAGSLGRIGAVKSIPPLVEALSDNSSAVRARANQALKDLTGRDFGYEANPLISERLKPEELAAAQIAKRQEAIDKWTAWWNETLGVAVLVDRFWTFQAQWKMGDPSRLYDKDLYLRDLTSRSYIFFDPKGQLERAARAADRFAVRKNFLQQDAVDLGAPALEKLPAYLSGATDGDKGLAPDLQARSRACVRLFVAETIAKLVAKLSDSSKVSGLRDKVSSGSKEEKVGAALALGYLPASAVTDAEREVLEKRGLEDGEAEVREASARSLARVGTAQNGAGLAKVATTIAADKAGEQAQVAALWALIATKPKNAEVVRALGEMVGGDAADKRSPSPLVREFACEAIGAIADPSALQNRWIARARVDSVKTVRDAAGRAIKAIGAASPEAAQAAADLLKDDKSSSIDRTGGALALGEIGDGKFAHALVRRLVDENPPTVLSKDSDPSVRAAVCEALGLLGEAGRYVEAGQALIASLTDASEEVQRTAYDALKKISGGPLPEFKVEDKAEDKAKAVADIQVAFDQAKGSWKQMGQ